MGEVSKLVCVQGDWSEVVWGSHMWFGMVLYVVWG